ncbi:MAG: hypothetical protein AAFP20_00860 [Cyanobacteria bacterium J06614_10]
MPRPDPFIILANTLYNQLPDIAGDDALAIQKPLNELLEAAAQDPQNPETTTRLRLLLSDYPTLSDWIFEHNKKLTLFPEKSDTQSIGATKGGIFKPQPGNLPPVAAEEYVCPECQRYQFRFGSKLPTCNCTDPPTLCILVSD